LSVALCLEQSFSSSFSFSICFGGQPQREGDARRPVRTEPLPTMRVRFIRLHQSVIFATFCATR
jgi:hypothetical protein